MSFWHCHCGIDVYIVKLQCMTLSTRLLVYKLHHLPVCTAIYCGMLVVHTDQYNLGQLGLWKLWGILCIIFLYSVCLGQSTTDIISVIELYTF